MGQGSPDPVRPYHAHWATCVVGEAAPAYFLAGEAIEPGVTVVWGVHWGGHPPPDQDDPTRRTPSRTPPEHRSECEERGGARSGERTASHRWAPMDSEILPQGVKGRTESGGRWEPLSDHQR